MLYSHHVIVIIASQTITNHPRMIQYISYTARKKRIPFLFPHRVKQAGTGRGMWMHLEKLLVVVGGNSCLTWHSPPSPPTLYREVGPAKPPLLIILPSRRSHARVTVLTTYCTFVFISNEYLVCCLFTSRRGALQKQISLGVSSKKCVSDDLLWRRQLHCNPARPSQTAQQSTKWQKVLDSTEESYERIWKGDASHKHLFKGNQPFIEDIWRVFSV